jgi:hypothetical protein
MTAVGMSLIGSKAYCVSPLSSEVLDEPSLELHVETFDMGAFEPWQDSWVVLSTFSRTYPWIDLSFGEDRLSMVA